MGTWLFPEAFPTNPAVPGVVGRKQQKQAARRGGGLPGPRPPQGARAVLRPPTQPLPTGRDEVPSLRPPPGLPGAHGASPHSASSTPPGRAPSRARYPDRFPREVKCHRRTAPLAPGGPCHHLSPPSAPQPEHRIASVSSLLPTCLQRLSDPVPPQATPCGAASLCPQRLSTCPLAASTAKAPKPSSSPPS